MGAKIQAGAVQGEHAGLDAFQSLLGRLNGKSEAENIRAQSARQDVRRVTYVEQRWGPMRFVKGGLLAQTKSDKETEETGDVSQEAAKATVADMAIGERQSRTREGKREGRKKKQEREGEEHRHATDLREMSEGQDKLHGTAAGKKDKENKREAQARGDTSLPSQFDSPIRAGSENEGKETERGKKDKNQRRKKEGVEMLAETGIPSLCKDINDRSEKGKGKGKKKRKKKHSTAEGKSSS